MKRNFFPPDRKRAVCRSLFLRFIQIDDPEWKNKYQKYLSLRFRPALSTLIREGDLTRIRALCSFAPVTESALNSFIDVAVQNQQEEILSFLMKLKKDRFGFHDREFTL